jgi:DNA-binding FadR family transcriptional regulator
MPPEKTARTRYVVAEQLRAFIKNHHLLPGMRLPGEFHLATTLSTSRPTLRASMVVLEMAGEIEIRRGAGAYILKSRSSSSIDLLDAPGPMEILRARLALESRLAAEAAQKADSFDFRNMEQLTREMKGTPEGSWFIALDRAFHLAVATAAKQPLVRDLLGGLIDGMGTVPMGAAILLSRSDEIADHGEIQEAIRDKDVSSACLAMRHHLRHVQEHLTNRVDQNSIHTGDIPRMNDHLLRDSPRT